MILYTSFAESDGTGSGLNVSVPAGSVANDYALLVMLSSNNFVYTLPSGWTLLVDAFSGTNLPLRVWGKSLGSETSVTVSGSAGGSGNPWMLGVVVAHSGAPLVRSAGGSSAGNFTYTVTGTTNAGEAQPPGPYVTPPQTGDILIYVGAGYAVPPPTPPTSLNVGLGAGALLAKSLGTHATGFGSYLQLLITTATAASAGDVSVAATVTTNNGVGAVVVALYLTIPQTTVRVRCSISTYPPVSVSCNNPPPGITGSPYSHPFPAIYGLGPYTFSVTGALPPGLTLNTATGVVSGTPGLAGTYSFTVNVSDNPSMVVPPAGWPPPSLPQTMASVACSITVTGTPYPPLQPTGSSGDVVTARIFQGPGTAPTKMRLNAPDSGLTATGNKSLRLSPQRDPTHTI